MAYLPLKSSRKLVVYKNGQLYESGITLDFMLLTAAQSNKFNEILNAGYNMGDVSNIGFWADGHLPTNPIFTPAELSVGLALGARVSPLCFSDYLYNVLTNVNDEIIIYSMDNPSQWGIGFKYQQTVDSRRKALCFVFVLQGTKKYDNNVFTIGTSGSGASTAYWRFFFGVMMDRDNEYAYPFVVHGYYSLPYDNYDEMKVRTYNSTSQNFQLVREGTYKIFSNIPPEPTPDPYAGGGTSTGTGTATGTFDDTSEDVDLPLTYGMTPCNVGLVSQYVMTATQISDFAAWLWNTSSVLDDLKRIFASPFDAIISVGMLPYTPSDTTAYNVKLGTLNVTGCTGDLVNDPVDKISMGSITFDGYYGSALDFNPYTKIEMYLPYCGTITLNPDEVMNHTISVDYYVDSLSGDIDAFISDEKRVLQIIKGNCFVPIPLTGRDFSSVYSSALGAVSALAVGAGAAVATGGMSAPIAVGMGTSVAANALNAKEQIKRVSSLGGMSGFMSIQNAYVIMTIPRQCLPELQNDHQGYPLFVTKKLSDFAGYTEVYEIHLDGLDCTDDEAKEIYELLKGGVIL